MPPDQPEAIAIIKDEHRKLGAVLSCLRSLVEEIEARGLAPDFKVFQAILTYLESFLNTYHHPKETSYLFPAVRRRCPEAGEILDRLEQQHRQEEELLHDLRTALAAYEQRGGKAGAGFFEAARRYVDFERAHATLEEREILPLARSHLSEADWAPIVAAFTANDDPLFGTAPRESYRDLLRAIVNLAPAPHGVAEPWPPAG